MTEKLNDFRVTSAFEDYHQFCGKPKLTKSCLLIFCIFCLTEKELIHLLHLSKYKENEIFYYTPQKIRQKEKKYNPTS